jgi:hypothetical protein
MNLFVTYGVGTLFLIHLFFITAQAISKRGKDMLFSGSVFFAFQIGTEVEFPSIMHVSF